jgi:hypothetical protein
VGHDFDPITYVCRRCFRTKAAAFADNAPCQPVAPIPAFRTPDQPAYADPADDQADTPITRGK